MPAGNALSLSEYPAGPARAPGVRKHSRASADGGRRRCTQGGANAVPTINVARDRLPIWPLRGGHCDARAGVRRAA